METLFTIGYTKTSLRNFVDRLRDAGVDCVADVRLHNTSQLAGFAKRDDLEFILTEGFGIGYIHRPEFAPAEGLFDTIKKRKNWNAYVDGYLNLIEERSMAHDFLRLAEEQGFRKPCLLYAEDKPEKCHRRLLVEAIADAVEGLEVVHL